MSISSRLLKVGSLAGSMGVYLPAMIFHKALGLTRVLLFAHFLRSAPTQYDLWGLGLMIFSLLAPLLCLGSNHGLTRYVSFYQARGRLRQFYSRARWAVLACCLALGLAALAADKPITAALISVTTGKSDTGFEQQVLLCQVTIANATAMALYYNLLAFLSGMRLYRLISAIEITFGLLFAALGCGALSVDASGLSLLLAHLASVVAALVGGLTLLHVAVHRSEGEGKLGTDPTFPPGEPIEANVGAKEKWGLSLVFLRFGAVALVGGELGVAAGQLSFFLVSKFVSREAGGVFGVFRQLAEPVAFLSGAAWTVLYGHAARRWEGGNRKEAVFGLQTAYKAVAAATMTLTVLLQAASPLWLNVLDPQWRQGAALLPGLLLFYQMMGNLGLVSMASWLLERPALALLPPAAALAANLALAHWWISAFGPEGAAWAAGAGMAAGGGLAAVLCLLAGRLKLAPSTYFLLLSPALMALAIPAGWAPLAAWAAILAAAWASDWLFDRRQKAYLRSAAERVLAAMRGRGTA